MPSDLSPPISSGLEPDMPSQQAASIGGSAGEELPEFVQLFYAVEALRTRDKVLVLQFAGIMGSEGVTTIASGFARMAAREYGRPVLYLHATLPSHSERVARAPRSDERSSRTSLLPLAAGNIPNLQVITMPSGPASGGRNIDTDMQMHIEACRDQYGLVILDSPAVTTAPRTAALSRLCDGTILVVQAERTTARAVKAAQASVERLGGQVIGFVFNRTRQRLPGWLTRRL